MDIVTPQPTSSSESVVPPTLTPSTDLEPTPELPIGKSRHISPIIPMLFGFVIVVIAATILAGLYYFSRLKKEVASFTPTPTPTPTVQTSIVPSPTPTPSIIASTLASPTPKATPPISQLPSTTPAPSSTPTPTPLILTLDIRFGNPSAHVKQTYDDGSGAGRVINREYSSIQVGEFDEVKTVWSPKTTLCFHVVSNTDIEGNKLTYTLTEDSKVVSEGTLSQYTKIEAGKTYDVCHDSTTSIGSHKLELTVNNTKALSEVSYANNTARLDFKNLADNIAPNFTLLGPNNEGSDGTCLFPQYIEDNVSSISNLKIEQKLDSNDWTTYNAPRYCFVGEKGSSHTYAIRITDERGNSNEQRTTFNLY